MHQFFEHFLMEAFQLMDRSLMGVHLSVWKEQCCNIFRTSLFFGLIMYIT